MEGVAAKERSRWILEKRECGKRQGAASEKRRLLNTPLPPTKSTRAEPTTTPARDWSMLCARRARAPGLGGHGCWTTGHGRNNGQEKGQERAVNVMARWLSQSTQPVTCSLSQCPAQSPSLSQSTSRASLPPPPAYQMFASLLGCHYSVTGAETVHVCSLGPSRHNCLACLT